MPGFDTHFLPLYDENKTLCGVWLSPELWAKAQKALSPIIHKALEKIDPASVPETPERGEDWELLAKYWDFAYPLPTDVCCAQCGAHTEDWRKDEPRVFKLRSATIGGLANFECLRCKARIVKKHFKNKVDVQCLPHVERP